MEDKKKKSNSPETPEPPQRKMPVPEPVKDKGKKQHAPIKKK